MERYGELLPLSTFAMKMGPDRGHRAGGRRCVTSLLGELQFAVADKSRITVVQRQDRNGDIRSLEFLSRRSEVVAINNRVSACRIIPEAPRIFAIARQGVLAKRLDESQRVELKFGGQEHAAVLVEQIPHPAAVVGNYLLDPFSPNCRMTNCPMGKKL
jgi:hypothetical protein